MRAINLRDPSETTDLFCEILRCKIKNSLRLCKKTLDYLSGKQRVCATNPQNLLRNFGRQATGLSDKPQNFVLACLLGRKFSFDLFCRFARLLGGNNKKAIVIKRLLFCYLFCGLLFLKSSKRFFKSSLFSASMSVSSTFLLLNQSGNVSFLGS